MADNPGPVCQKKKKQYLISVLAICGVALLISFVFLIVGSVVPLLGGIFIAIGVLLLLASIITAIVLMVVKYPKVCDDSSE